MNKARNDKRKNRLRKKKVAKKLKTAKENKEFKMNRDIHKLDMLRDKTFKEISELSKEHISTVENTFKENIKAITSKLKVLRTASSKKGKVDEVRVIDVKLANYRRLLVQYEESKTLKFLNSVDISEYASDPKLFFSDLIAAELKLKDDVFNYRSLTQAIGLYSKDEFIKYTPLFARFDKFILTSNLNDNYYIISNFLTILYAGTNRFKESLNKFFDSSNGEDVFIDKEAIDENLKGSLNKVMHDAKIIEDEAIKESDEAEANSGADVVDKVTEVADNTETVKEPELDK